MRCAISRASIGSSTRNLDTLGAVVSRSDLDLRTTSWLVGVSGVFGVEWMPHRRVALHAEYGEEASVKWGRQDQAQRDWNPYYTTLDRVRDRPTTWALQSRGVLAGFTVYL